VLLALEESLANFFEPRRIVRAMRAFKHLPQKHEATEQHGVAVKHGGILLQIAVQLEQIGEAAKGDQTAQLNPATGVQLAGVRHGLLPPLCRQS
jgi:hypothetical protein